MAKIQFYVGIDEETVPEVRLTRSRSGNMGTATFTFENPNALTHKGVDEITGMYMIDEDGQIVSREVKAKFINGQPVALEGIYVMRTIEEWDRFMLFMERYAEKNGLGFSKA